MAQVVAATFGPGHTPAWLSSHQSELAQTIASNVALESEGLQAHRGEEDLAAQLVRTRSYHAARLAGGAELDQALRRRSGADPRHAGLERQGASGDPDDSVKARKGQK